MLNTIFFLVVGNICLRCSPLTFEFTVCTKSNLRSIFVPHVTVSRVSFAINGMIIIIIIETNERNEQREREREKKATKRLIAFKRVQVKTTANHMNGMYVYACVYCTVYTRNCIPWKKSRRKKQMRISFEWKPIIN